MVVSADSIPVKIEAYRLNRSAPSKVVSVFWPPLPCANLPALLPTPGSVPSISPFPRGIGYIKSWDYSLNPLCHSGVLALSLTWMTDRRQPISHAYMTLPSVADIDCTPTQYEHSMRPDRDEDAFNLLEASIKLTNYEEAPKRSVVLEPHGSQSDFQMTAMSVGGFSASSTDAASRKPKTNRYLSSMNIFVPSGLSRLSTMRDE